MLYMIGHIYIYMGMLIHTPTKKLEGVYQHGTPFLVGQKYTSFSFLNQSKGVGIVVI